jgi:hypothetical protein
MSEENKVREGSGGTERPFRMHAITVGGKYLTHDNIVEAAEYFLQCRQRHLKECFRVNMAKLASLGHEFTAEEWRAALDSEDAETLTASISAPNAEASDR